MIYDFDRKKYCPKSTTDILKVCQGSTIIIKMLYVIMYAYQNFAVCDVHGLMPKKHISIRIIQNSTLSFGNAFVKIYPFAGLC